MRFVRCVLVAAVIAPGFGCGRQVPAPPDPAVHGSPAPAAQTPPEDLTKKSPRLWSDDQAVEAIKLLGYDDAYLLRWENSGVDGWVELDGNDGPKRVPLDNSGRASREKKDKFDATGISGFVVVGLRKQPAVVEGDELFEVRVEESWSYKSEVRAVFKGASHTGKLKRGSKQDRAKNGLQLLCTFSPNSFTRLAKDVFALKKYVGEQPVSWLELQLAGTSD